MKVYLFIVFNIVSLTIFSQKIKFPKVICTIKEHSTYKQTITSQTRREVKYLGLPKDTLRIGKLENSASAIGNNLILVSEASRTELGHYNSHVLKIHLDTKTILTTDEYIDGHKFYKAYSVIILNQTDSTIIVGKGWHIPIALEAKSKNGVWFRVEQDEFIFDCGVGLEYILLKPNNIMCVTVPIYKGNFRTKLRYRLGCNYSEEFWGEIPNKISYRVQ